MIYKDFTVLIGSIFLVFEIFIILSFLKKKQYNYFFENIIILIAVELFLFYVYKSKFEINSIILCLVIMTIIGHLFVGQYLNFYHSSKTYDRALHFVGALSFSLFLYSIIYNFLRPVNYSKLYVFLFVTGLGISIGVFFEIIEFILDTFLKTQHQHSLKDTDLDLICNVIGACIAGIISIIVFQ